MNNDVNLDAAQKLIAEQQRQDFPRLFKSVSSAAAEFVPVVDDPLASGTSAGRRRAGMDEESIQYLTKIMGIEYRLKQTGIHAATILNRNPWPLKVNSTLLQDIVVPACPQGRPYSVSVLRNVLFSRKDEIDGIDNPVEWHPIQQAREFNDAHYNKGGVIIYMGDGEKEDPAITMKNDPAIQRNFEEASARQLTYFREQVSEATGWDRSPNAIEKKAITDRHRDMAMILSDMTGEELPAWVSKTPGKFGLGEKCPRCNTVPASGAYMCPTCTNILDARKAYENGDIDITDESLKKLDRAVLVDMGISELIPRTIAERNADNLKEAERLRKEAAKGKK